MFGFGAGIVGQVGGAPSLAARVAALFRNGEQGVWFDPSDISTLYQDAAGTTPVTAMEQPVGLMLDKSGRGNHCTFKAGTGRPVLSARVNMLTYTEDFSNAAWLRVNSAISGGFTSPTGTLTAQKIEVATNASAYIRQSAVVNTTSVMASVYVKKGSGATEANRFVLYNVTTSTVLINGTLNYDTGAWAYSSGSTGVTVAAAAGGWWRVEISTASGITAGNAVALYVGFTGVTENAGTHLYAWGADLRPTNDGIGLPAYQRVDDSSTYDTAGFPPYLRADGTDDGGSTNSIDFTGTDKVTVFTGVRKLSDALFAPIVELSSSADANNGSFVVGISTLNGDASRRTWASKVTGTSGNLGGAFVYSAPDSRVMSASFDIAGTSSAAENSMRLNGVVQSLTYSPNDAGTGNYGNYPLFLFARNNAAPYFNGRLYSLIVLGRAATATEIANTERYLNMKAKVY